MAALKVMPAQRAERFTADPPRFKVHWTVPILFETAPIVCGKKLLPTTLETDVGCAVIAMAG